MNGVSGCVIARLFIRASAGYPAVQTISSLSGGAFVEAITAISPAINDAIIDEELRTAAPRAEEMRLAGNIAPALGDKSPAFLAVAFPATVGSASSRYTFDRLSPIAWLGIVLSMTRWDVPRINPVCT
jgi:hypothetical protein